MKKIQIKRAYEKPSPSDGYRILVDKYWPRGIKKEDLKDDCWEKDIEPTDAIRKAFGHKDENFPTFKKEYLKELKNNPDMDAFIEKIKNVPEDTVTLVYGARNEKSNHAIILKNYIEQKLKEK